MPTSAPSFYYSGYGHTAKQAEAVRQGVAEVKGAQVNVYRIDKDGNLPEASLDAIAKADAVIYGAPRIWGVQPGSSRRCLIQAVVFAGLEGQNCRWLHQFRGA